MNFDYHSYVDLLNIIRQENYTFCNYHNYADSDRCVILRHDIDSSLERAVKLAEVEHDQGVHSTYFALLRTDFYNVASAKGYACIRRIHELGHDIGLHFDEKTYNPHQDIISAMAWEAGILSEVCDVPVKSVSMHRPSQETLEADYQIPGLVNTYGQTFFREFKYLSDSRRRWRYPVKELIQSGQYSRFQILTHPFWYSEENRSLEQSIFEFVNHANLERYYLQRENIRDLDAIMSRNEVK